MRNNIVHPGAGELQYEIRSIVAFANDLAQAGVEIIWENIGDPVVKGELVPEWVQDIVASAAKQSVNYGYSPTKGLDRARQYLSEVRSQQGAELQPENIIFFNGLGDAITKVYTWLNPTSRVLGPSPAYPTHSSVEGAHGRSRHITYQLDPNNGWLPNMEEVRQQVRYNPSIAALLIINPDNPTGVVYPRHILEEFVAIAEEFDLFLIVDEIYANLVYEGVDYVSLATLTKQVPLMVMRGLSKEVPWPGSRCGWIEFYNVHKDGQFARYAESIEEAKMIEVCSTTLPQAVLPDILSDERYVGSLRVRTQKYARRGQEAVETLNQIEGVKVVMPQGAFYLSVHLGDDLLGRLRSPDIQDERIAQLLTDKMVEDEDMPTDKRFCLNLLASTGVCVVPMTSGFNSHVAGFRMTLLEEDDAKFTHTLGLIGDYIRQHQ